LGPSSDAQAIPRNHARTIESLLEDGDAHDNYKAIFEAVEATLITVGSQNAPVDQIRRNFDWYKRFDGRPLSEADHRILVYVTFYSGFNAATVNAKLDVIRKHFPDHETVADYDNRSVDLILEDRRMTRNRRKVQACVKGARTFRRIVDEHGSFQKYLDSFGSPMPAASP
jgi:hypothetical protein